MSLHQIVYTQRDHCIQNAVIAYQWRCPYIEVVLTTKVYCNSIIGHGVCLLGSAATHSRCDSHVTKLQQSATVLK